MKALLKGLGRGIWYFFTPFIWIIGIAVGGVVGLVVFFGYALYSIFLFFTGRNMFKELPEDIKVNDLKEAEARRAQEADNPQNPIPNPYAQPMPQQPYPPQYQQPYPQQPYQQPVQPQVVPQPYLQQPVQQEQYPQNAEQSVPVEPQFERQNEGNPSSFEQQSEEIIVPNVSEEDIEEYIPAGEDVDENDLKGDYE